jgi:hypothetical protein
MKRMVGMVSLGSVLLVPAFAASHQRTVKSTEYVWRLRAYEDVDCALAILDEALKAEGSLIGVACVSGLITTRSTGTYAQPSDGTGRAKILRCRSGNLAATGGVHPSV